MSDASRDKVSQGKSRIKVISGSSESGTCLERLHSFQTANTTRPAASASNRPTASSSTKPAAPPLAPFQLTLETPDTDVDAEDDSLVRAVVCEEAVFKGNVSVGCGTVIHPRARILSHSSKGSIRIGRNCIIEEEVVIENSSDETMIIGDENTFEVGAWIEATLIGHLNTFGVKCHVTQGLKVGDRCIVGPLTTLSPLNADIEDKPPGDSTAPKEESVADYTITYGSDSSRRIWDGSGQEQARAERLMHLQYLREVLPKYNHIRKPSS